VVVLVRDQGPLRLSLTRIAFAELRGWADDDQTVALSAFLRSCAHIGRASESAAVGPISQGVDYGVVAEWAAACRAAAAVLPADKGAARRFFESAFTPMAIADYGERNGLFTGYFESELNGSRRRHGPYQTPIYRRPSDLGKAPPLSRTAIEEGALAGRGLELFWVDDPIGAFFLQIQGSGRIRLDDGHEVRVGYDSQNGLPYVAVGRLLLERGLIPRGKVTMASISAWMGAHPAAGAALRREDPSYVFFRVISGDGPIGAERVALMPERSLAVDRSYLPLGAPMWLDAAEQFLPARRMRRLVVAQDTGGAIMGPVRGDLFWGSGAAAGERAGAMDARGDLYVLLPQSVAARIAAANARW
jgi:membrane-bound lytic murein transglycosylase A